MTFGFVVEYFFRTGFYKKKKKRLHPGKFTFDVKKTSKAEGRNRGTRSAACRRTLQCFIVPGSTPSILTDHETGAEFKQGNKGQRFYVVLKQTLVFEPHQHIFLILLYFFKLLLKK